MNVKVLIITQTNIGKSLLNAARVTYKKLPIPVITYCVEGHDDPDELLQELQHQVKIMDKGGGVLILTDLYGSTPSNIAHEVQKTSQVKISIVAGINLPMLIKVLNYPQAPLNTLVEKAIQGGKQGICCQGDCENDKCKED